MSSFPLDDVEFWEDGKRLSVSKLGNTIFTEGMKHDGQGMIKFRMGGGIYVFTFFVKDKLGFINAMNKIWDIVCMKSKDGQRESDGEDKEL